MDGHQKIDTRTYITGAALILALISASIGGGWRLVEDRMAVEKVAIETSAALESISSDVGEMKDAFKSLAQNRADLRLLEERTEAQQKELDKHDERIERLERR